MQILHLTGESEDTGGVLTVLRNLVTVTRPWGWHNAVWVNQAFQEKRSPPLVLLRNPHICADSFNHLQLLSRAAAALPGLYRQVREHRFDVVHAHSRGGILAGLGLAILTGQPIVFTNHNYPRRLGLYQRIARHKQVWTVLLTPNMGRHCQIPIQEPRVRIISECCSDELFHVPVVRPQATRDSDQPIRLVGMGSLLRWKNWHIALKALDCLTPAERQRFSFDLWGPTPDFAEARAYEAELRQSVERMKLDSLFKLRGATTSPIKELRKADWIIHPATNEPCSVAVIESLALGLRVVTSASGGMVDIIQAERNGLLFQPDDPEDLACQLRRILRGNFNLAAPEEIRRSVEMRSATAVARQYAEVYQLARRRPAGY